MLLTLMLASTIAAQTPVEQGRAAVPQLRYLDPGQIQGLPAGIRGDLQKLDCRIPKFNNWDARHNVIQGQFLKAGQIDWAILCRTRDMTGILLYPGGMAVELPMLRAQPADSTRALHAVSAFVLQKRAIRDHPEAPALFDHDGIEDGPIQQPGHVLYYRDDAWTEY